MPHQRGPGLAVGVHPPQRGRLLGEWKIDVFAGKSSDDREKRHSGGPSQRHFRTLRSVLPAKEPAPQLGNQLH